MPVMTIHLSMLVLKAVTFGLITSFLASLDSMRTAIYFACVLV